MWVAVGIGVAALTVGGSVYGANKSAESAKDANQTQWDMYNQAQQNYKPFLDPSGRAMATLQSSIYGGDFGYKDPKNPRRQLSASFQPIESEAFKYNKQRTLDDLGRELRMMGRGSGTVAANAYGRTLGDLNVANEEQQRNQLWNLVKTGQGAAGSITGLGQGTATNVANTILQNGQTQASLYSGMGPALINGAGAMAKSGAFE